MTFGRATTALFAIIALAVSGCATPDPAELGENKQEFEQSSQGGVYRFQFTSEGPDGYRTVLWRQGDSLSDDMKDEKLVAGVVRAVFLDRFCKEIKEPVSLADGSPRPAGGQGKWVASLRCAAPPPPPAKPKPEKKKAKPKSAPGAEAETASKPKPDADAPPAAAAEASSEAKPKSEPKRNPAYDGPVVCEANGKGGFDCKPKR